jgi:DNA anti-recombination protein RmuC
MRSKIVWLFGREDSELRALRKQLKEVEEAKKRAEVESAARIKQIREDGRKRLEEIEAEDRAQRKEFIRQLEELARQSGRSYEELFDLVRKRMEADLKQLTEGSELAEDDKPPSKSE